MSIGHALKTLWHPTEDLVAEAAHTQDTATRPDTFLHQLKFRIHQRLGSPYPGEYRGLFKGHGMDLKDLREYQPGDEIRKMEWNVLARTGVPHVKEHYEEKQVQVWFFMDATAPMYFGQRQTKLAYAKTLMSLVGLLSIEAGHQVGLILWTGTKTPVFIKPKPTLTQLQGMIQKVDSAMMLAPSQNLEPDFPELNAIFQNRCLVFLFSDFAFLKTIPTATRTLARLPSKHQLYSFLLVDPVEEALVSHCGWIPVFEGSPNETLWINTDDPKARADYQQHFQEQLLEKSQILSHWSRYAQISTASDPIETVVQWVKAS